MKKEEKEAGMPCYKGKEWATRVNDETFATYLTTEYGENELPSSEFEAIARGFYETRIL